MYSPYTSQMKTTWLHSPNVCLVLQLQQCVLNCSYPMESFQALLFPAFTLETLQGKKELKDVYFASKPRGQSKEHMRIIKYGCMWQQAGLWSHSSELVAMGR